MQSDLVILTPGSYPYPSSRSSSVELALMAWTPYLQGTLTYRILGRPPGGSRESRRAHSSTLYPVMASPGLPYVERSIAIMEELNPSIIQVENRPVYIPLLRRAFPSKRLLLNLHSVTFLSRGAISRNRLIQAFQQADAILVNSLALKGVIRRILPGIEEKVMVVPLGVDERRFHPVTEEEKRRLKIKYLGRADRPVLLYVGRLIPQKGIHLLLEAAGTLHRKGYPFLLLIAGGSKYGSNRETPYVKKLKKMAESLRHSVRFLPYIDHEKIHPLYAAADLFLAPSIGFEAFGLVLLEAMASGIPVIASANGGMKEILRHGENGLLFPTGDAGELGKGVERLLLKSDERKRMGEMGRREVEARFTWREVAGRMEEVYQRFLPDAEQ